MENKGQKKKTVPVKKTLHWAAAQLPFPVSRAQQQPEGPAVQQQQPTFPEPLTGWPHPSGRLYTQASNKLRVAGVAVDALAAMHATAVLRRG